jgi:MFS family permease
LTTALHTFTHAYGAMLVPLYLLMVADLKLRGVGAASLVVTIYGLVYFLGSYGAGVLADRFNRKGLLGIGLLGNGLAITLMGLTRQYELVLALGMMAGLFGTLFHPAANALVTAHYPKNPGMAIGLLGIGSGLGFFFGPQYAGWRAQSAHWRLAGLSVGDWQRPCVELGLAGIVVAVIFLLWAREIRPPSPGRKPLAKLVGAVALPGRIDMEGQVLAYEPAGAAGVHPPLGRALRGRIIGIALVLGCRDFAGVAGLSLASIYLQKAHRLDVKQAGFIIGAMMLLSVLINPLAAWLTAGGRRLPALAGMLVAGGLVVFAVPYVPVAWALPVLCGFMTMQMGSYTVSDAAILERVDPAVRGRVVGLFLMLAGTFGSTGPWVMGFWTDRMGQLAYTPRAYGWPFGVLGVMMFVAALATPLIAALGEARQHVAEGTLEPSPPPLEAAVSGP